MKPIKSYYFVHHRIQLEEYEQKMNYIKYIVWPKIIT